MAKEVALTNIKHGDGDQVTEWEPGEEVDGLDKETMDHLRANGAIGEPPRTQQERDQDREALLAELEALRARNAELEATATQSDAPNDPPKVPAKKAAVSQGGKA
jgi:hypothetical protein